MVGLFFFFFFRGTVHSLTASGRSQCPILPLATNSSSSEDTTTIVLATVLPVSFVGCCCFCLLFAVVLLFLYRWRHRTRLYDVDSADHVEMGRRGMTRFSYREIDPDELTIGDLLGAGAYGQVRPKASPPQSKRLDNFTSPSLPLPGLQRRIQRSTGGNKDV